jgi:hypothetical protein
MKVGSLSISAVKMFMRCGEQYRLKKELGPMPPGIALIRGRGVDAAANLNMFQKAKTRTDLPVDELEAAAADEVETSFHGPLALTPQERLDGIAIIKGKVKDGTVSIVRTYAADLAPKIQPGLLESGEPAVQARITANLPQVGLDLVGVLDLEDEAEVVRDLKTSGKSPVKDAAEKSAQLTMYSLLRRALRTAATHSRLALDTVVLTESGKCYAAPTQETDRGPEEQFAMVERLATVKGAIEKEIFIPTDPENWACSDRFCGYYHVCRYVQRGAARPTS